MINRAQIDNDKIKLKFKSILGGEIEYEYSKSVDAAWPVQFFTATSDMRDCIGNVTQMGTGTCTVKALYRGKTTELRNVRILDNEIKNNGDRVMVTEHLTVGGRMELVATKKPLLKAKHKDLNFINIGWSNKRECSFMRIDVYTGEVEYSKCLAVFTKLY